MLRAEVFEKQSSKKPTLVSNFSFSIRQKVQHVARTPVMTPMCTRSITSCCCIHRGFMCLQAQVHEPTVCPYQPLHLSVDAHNESTRQATNIFVKFEEIVTWKVRGHRGSRKINIGSVDLDPTRVSNMERVQKAHRRASRKSAQTHAADTTSSNLSSGNGVFITFPTNTDNVTYEGSMISVKHMVKAKVKTARCITDPKISYPITVANCVYTNSESRQVAHDAGTGQVLQQNCIQQMYTTPIAPNAVYPPSLPVNREASSVANEEQPPPSYQMVRDLLPPDWNGSVAPPVAFDTASSGGLEADSVGITPTAPPQLGNDLPSYDQVPHQAVAKNSVV